jgi:hypothetical protein
LFLGYLKKNPAVFDKLLEGWDGRDAFDKWRLNGMPRGDGRIRKPRIPFFLWDDSDTEIKDAELLYLAEKNCIQVSIQDFYNRVSKHYPLFEHYWYGINRDSVAKDMIDYMKFKLGIKPNEE